MSSEDAYRPPIAESPTNHSTFSPDEWRWMARIFTYWIIGLALLAAIVITTQMYMSLSQFGGEEYLARVVTLAVFARFGPGIVVGAACNTLVMITERRAHQSILAPIQRLPWSLVGLLMVATPFAMLLTLAVSLGIGTWVLGLPGQASWANMQGSAHWMDLAISIGSTFVVAMVLMASVTSLTRMLSRIRGWLFLKFVVMSQVVGLLLVPVHWVAGGVRAM